MSSEPLGGQGSSTPVRDRPEPAPASARDSARAAAPRRRPLFTWPPADPVRFGAGVAVAALTVFNAFWRLSVADWKTDELLDSGAAWKAVNGDWSPEIGHPIFIRWFLGAGQLMFGQNRFGVRFFPVLASLALALLLFAFGRRLAGYWAGLLAAGIWGIVPRPILIGFQETFVIRPDRYAYLESFSALFLLAAVWAGWSWIREGRWSLAVATGVLAGLGMSFKPTVAVALPAIVLAALLVRRAFGTTLAQGAVLGATSVAVLLASYLPMGTAGPAALWRLIQFQRKHIATGHTIVLGASRNVRQPWWSPAWYQWNGTGAIVTLALIGGGLVALTSRHRAVAAYLYAVLLTTFIAHALSPVDLPHYFLLWFPLEALLAAIGIVDLLGRKRPLAFAGMAMLAVLLVAGGAGTRRVAELQPGNMGQVETALHRAGVHPAFIVYASEPISKYFPGSKVAFIGYGDSARPADVMLLDHGYAQYLSAASVEQFRRRALTLGLMYHQVGDIEVWYR